MRPQTCGSCGAAFLGILLCGLGGISCAIRPPHYAGEIRGRTASEAQRPAWTEWGLTFQDGFAYIPGTASHSDRKKALSAAEEQGRNRLAAAIETRIVSELEHEVAIDARLGPGGARKVEERQAIETRLRALADVVVQGAVPAAEYLEEYETFGKGWEKRYEYWVLVKLPESEYYRQLDVVRGKQ